MSAFHPDLTAARFIPKIPITSRIIRLIPTPAPHTTPMPDDVVSEDVTVERGIRYP
jgi:hypothetical protein